MMTNSLQDAFHRQFYYLRLSLTDVCNFKCTYCLPNGYQPVNHRPQFLSLSEIRLVTQAFAACGTSKIRLTGGEPTLRRDLTEIIRQVATVQGVQTVAMTTNGYRLAKHIREWRDAGLTHVNVSMDSLDPRQFHQITGENRFEQVMRGIEQTLAVGFAQVKVNVVLLKGHHQQLTQYLEWIRDKPIQLRFIDLMQTGDNTAFFQQHHYSGVTFFEQLQQAGWSLKPRAVDAGPAQVLRHPDSLGEIGFIMPYAPQFCEHCNRLRISATGKLHLCLFGDAGIDLRDLMQSEAEQPALIARIRHSLTEKKQSHFLHDGQTGATPHLASIGG